ncbi:MAG: GlsB/YeaQ/YmgE family stress response membrane protein [Candidatus Omnitrophica bacterium]|nr:GlsB/YeaQ/YmgE family stress response membrane protein [Candidatus Omnitrophota bacterium]
MNATQLVWLLLIGLVAGWLAGLLMKGRGFGALGNILVGIVGAVIGGWLFAAVGLVAYGTAGFLIMAVVGASVLLGLISLVKRA